MLFLRWFFVHLPATLIHRYRWALILPVVWGVCCLVLYFNPGDEYGAYYIGTVFAIPLYSLFKPEFHQSIWSLLPVGLAVMWFTGWLSNKINISGRIWSFAFCVIFIALVIYTMPGQIRETGGQEMRGILCSLAFSGCLGLYAATILSWIAAASSKGYRTLTGRNRNPASK